MAPLLSQPGCLLEEKEVESTVDRSTKIALEEAPSETSTTTREITFDDLRSDIIGINETFTTPFGERLVTYADYTASGRALKFIEHYLETQVLPFYANTHTEDVYLGTAMTQMLHQAEITIKESVNAGRHGKIIACGSGSTAAISKIQQILGVFIPPATRLMYETKLSDFVGQKTFEEFAAHLDKTQPVVFVGPYEHHSNEISWRVGLTSVIEVRLAEDGGIDLDHLESLLKDEQYRDRIKIGSFSAASNVTGIRSDTRNIAKLLHENQAYACFDFAASAPYVEIDMNPFDSDGSHYDAVFISPHKFIGGPGSSGVLVFNERLYNCNLGPTVAGGGTVQYVNLKDHDFHTDIEEREKAGTPGVMQIMRASLVMELKTEIGIERIEEREHKFLKMAFDRWLAHPRIQIYGPLDVERRIPIVSFNILDVDRRKFIHPRFVSKLLNDLFGIQSRAGCSCTGPYGHRLLGVDEAASEELRSHIRRGYNGLKPGWCRLGFHFVHDDAEVEFIIAAVLFVADFGHRFLPLYDFDLRSGLWEMKETSSSIEVVKQHEQQTLPVFGIRQALVVHQQQHHQGQEQKGIKLAERKEMYRSYLDKAKKIAESLAAKVEDDKDRLGSDVDDDSKKIAQRWFRL